MERMKVETIYPLFLLFLIASLIVGFVSVSSESLWIDEFMTLDMADRPSFGEFWEALRLCKTSDGQMPLYMVYMWGWISFFGNSEVSIRLANLPWLLLAQAGLWFGFRSLGPLAGMVLLFSLCSPFVWFYMNEARPYIMQFAGSCILVGFCSSLILQGNTSREFCAKDAWLLFLGAFLTAGSSMLGVPWVATALLILLYFLISKKVKYKFTALLPSLFISVCLFGLLGLFYLYTLLHGARAAVIEGSLASSLGFSCYELFGFTGLGPGRLDLRAKGISTLWSYTVSLGAYLICLVYMTVALILRLKGNLKSEKVLLWSVLLVPPIAFLVVAGLLIDFRVLGRHFTPVLPVVLVFYGFCFLILFNRGAASKVVAIATVLLLTVSCFSIRFASRHAKDDYRSAAALAKKEATAGRTVWWIASRNGPTYYDLMVECGMGDPGDLPGSGCVVHLSNLSQKKNLADLASPSLILFSKPDLYDKYGTVREYIAQNSYRLVDTMPAFRVYRKQSDP